MKNIILKETERGNRIWIVAYSDKKLSVYTKKKETPEESDAQDAYFSAVGFLEMARYDEAERSAKDALRIYTKTNDTSNINACNALIDRISSERREEARNTAENITTKLKTSFSRGLSKRRIIRGKSIERIHNTRRRHGDGKML